MKLIKSIACSVDRYRLDKEHALRVAENCKRFRPQIKKEGENK